MGVTTRKKNDSYKRSSLQNKRLSETLKRKYAAGWKPFSDEWKLERSIDMKRRWRSGEMAEKTKITSIKKYGVEHWTQTAIARQNLSLRLSQKIYSPAMRRNMSLGARRRIRTRRESLYTFANGGIRQDLNCYFRSNWEANFRICLVIRGIMK